MKKIYLILIGVILFIPSIVLANSISNINMDIYVDKNGTAHIKEEWTVNLNEGTEGYKPYYNLGESKISNFKVKLNNKDYTFTDYWNVSDSFDDKKYKNGLNYISDGVELCFGISEYGSNKYELSYDINNFVVSTNDGYQMIYWTLFPYDYNPSPGRVYIKIYSDFAYQDTLDVWGYGKGGVPTYVYNGYIEMDSETKVRKDEYMTILVKFPKDTFNTNIILDNDFNYYYDMAEDGAVSYSSNNSKSDILIIILSFFFPILIIITTVVVSLNSVKYGTYRLKFNKKFNAKDTPYYRDIPYHKEDLARGYWIACQYNLIKKPTDYLGAILLKWLSLGNITIGKKENKSKEETIVIFNNCLNLSNEEIKLYQMMYEASIDGVLEKNEFTSWCKKNYTKILNWFNRVIDSETEKLISEGFLTKEGRRKCFVSSSLNEEAKKVAGLKKFLNDFSKIEDRSAIEVNIWEEYLMYAYIFGIAKKVMKEFKKLYPEVLTEEVYNNIDFIYFVSYNGINSATTARDRANGYSSGGGGFSSFGGGGGSFGGGGGGGGFR